MKAGGGICGEGGWLEREVEKGRNRIPCLGRGQRANHTLRPSVRIKGECKWCSGTFYEYTDALVL